MARRMNHYERGGGALHLSAEGRAMQRALRPHEAEDVDMSFSTAIARLVPGRPRDFQNINIHEATAWAGQFGRKLKEPALDLKNPHTSMQGRRESFPPSWAGPPTTDMAQAGLYYHATHHDMEFGNCYICDVTFRFPKNGNFSPWEEHKLAYGCLHLIRYNTGGPKETPEGKRPRSNSESSASDMMECELRE